MISCQKTVKSGVKIGFCSLYSGCAFIEKIRISAVKFPRPEIEMHPVLAWVAYVGVILC